MRNRTGWEHLRESLHVLITASDYTRARCATKLAVGVNRIMPMLSTDNDELKSQQFIQLAIINGTYRHTRVR
ncbi:unnamed protein product [Gongylonema pulchrum]|uniref:Uncharacterized protein n=1 Tax=Gongylonema pulchrum TaxID=637853 RepID=A0A3P7NRD3_9BILA|nr:unnamed protein product [Gongylonema pulchrum]